MAKTMSGIENEFGFYTDNAPDVVKANKVWLAIYEMAVGHEVTALVRERDTKRSLVSGSVKYGTPQFEAMAEDYKKSMQLSKELATVLTMLAKDMPIGYVDSADMMDCVKRDATKSFEEDC